jgi:hypothetical protein
MAGSEEGRREADGQWWERVKKALLMSDMEVRPEMRRAVLMKIENNIPDSETYER